jgi:hypothetical protein
MNQLPSNPHMLVSVVNTLLRDGEFESLEDLCAYYDREPDAVQQYLFQNGYTYNETLKQFK